LYMDLLKRYSEGQRDATGKIREALRGGDRALAERIAHTLKGVSGNIGASEAQTVAGELEAAIRVGLPETEVSEISGRLSSILATLIGHIDSCLAEAAIVTPATARDGGALHSITEIVGKLTHYAEESDGEALDYLESVRDELSEQCDRGYFEKLEASIRAFDFAAAIDILKSRSSCPDDSAERGKYERNE
jgi:two-component system, sensor histidine kinase and response regulator